MFIEDYGKWTRVWYHEEHQPRHFRGHQAFSYEPDDAVRGYEFIEFGEAIQVYGDYGKRLGWAVSEIIGIGVVNPRGVKVCK